MIEVPDYGGLTSTGPAEFIVTVVAGDGSSFEHEVWGDYVAFSNPHFPGSYGGETTLEMYNI